MSTNNYIRFDEIVNYNKDIVAYKREFFKNVCVEDLRNLLDFLSYNMDYYSENYRWGKRYYKESEGILTWVTSTDKRFKAHYYNRETRQVETYNKKAFLTDDMIKAHFLSCYGNGRKMGFYYKNKDKDLDRFDNSLKNLYKIHNKTFGLSISDNNDVLLIDIDNRFERPAILTLKNLLNYLKITINDLMMIEHNPFTGGIHIAIKLPNKINKPSWYKMFENELSAQDIVVECDFYNNILRLPLSYEYVAIKKSEEIFEYSEYIPNHLWEESFISYIDNLSDKVCNSEVLYKSINDAPKPVVKNKWENYWKIKKTLFFREEKKKNIEIYKFEDGKRWETQKHVVPYLAGMGVPLCDVANIIMKNNESSKDLSKWSIERYIEDIKAFYNKCNVVINWNYNDFNGFMSNLDKIPQQSLNFLNSNEFTQLITQRFIENYIKERNKHNLGIKSLSKEKQDILDRQIPLMIKEIIGLMFFHINDSKTTIVKERVGFQLSNTFMERLQKHCIKTLNMDSDNPLVKTSMQYLKSALVKTLSLKEIKYRNRKRNWQLGSCKSFEINSINDINELLKHFANILYNNWTKLSNNISINDSPILYILLGGNPYFHDYLEDYHNTP